MTLTSVLIPCWNALELTRDCLSQILRNTSSPYELIVIDDGSTDGTWGWLRRLRGLPRPAALRGLTLLRNERNLGYSRSLNRAIRASKGRLIVLGNADAAPGPGWLEAMSQLFSQRPRLGGLSPISRPDPTKTARPWSSLPLYGDLAGLDRYAVAWAMQPRLPDYLPAKDVIPGFWFATRRSVLRLTGLLDESFTPAYYEDWDLQRRIRRAGFELGFAPRVYVHHEGSGVCRRNGVDLIQAHERGHRALRAKYGASRWLLQLASPTARGLVFDYCRWPQSRPR